MIWRVTKSENPNAEFDVYWNDIGIDSEKLQSLKPYQKTNHFPAMYQITRKTYLAKNLKRLQKLYPLDFDFFPRTWVLPNEINELRAFASQKPKKQKGSPPKSKQMSQTPAPPSTSQTNNNTLSKDAEKEARESAATTNATSTKPAKEDHPPVTLKPTKETSVSPTIRQSRDRIAPPLSSHNNEIARNGFKLSQTLPNTATAKATVTADEETEESAEEDESEEEDDESNNTPTPAAAPKP